MKATGSYDIDDLNQGIRATQFPLPCHFQLVDTYNASDTFDAGTFLLVSTQGVAVTRSYSVVTTSMNSGIAVSTSSSTAAARVTNTDMNPSTDIQGRSSGLSGGLVATVVMGSLLGALGLGGLVWWILRRRKTRQRKLEDIKTPSKQSDFHEADSRRYGPELSGSGAPTLHWLARRELPASTWASNEYQPHSLVAHEMEAHR